MSQRTGDIRSDSLCDLHSDDIRGIIVPQDLAHKFLNAITIFQEKFCHTAEKKKGKEKKKKYSVFQHIYMFMPLPVILVLPISHIALIPP